MYLNTKMIVERENESTPRDERFETNFRVKFCPERVKGQKTRKRANQQIEGETSDLKMILKVRSGHPVDKKHRFPCLRRSVSSRAE